MALKPFRHNLRIPGIVRDEIRDGTKFLVVPVVMLQEQVLFCSNCHPDGEFVSGKEIALSAPAWDNRPVTLSHPTEDFTPDNHQRLEVGRVFNVLWNGRVLKGEMWLDVLKLKATMAGREAEKRFRDGEVTEVSTGYFVDRVSKSGKFEGTAFEITQKGIVPDHLAILTEEIGACSVAGGCGAPRRNSSSEDSMDERSLAKRLGLGIKALLALGKAVGDGSDDGDDKSGGPGNDDKGKEASMKKKELIALLLKAEKVEFSEEELGKMSDGQLKSLATLAGCDCGDDDAEAKKKAAAAKAKVEAEAKEKAEAEAKKKEDSVKRKELIASLLKTENAVFSEEELGKMTDDQLKSLATLAGNDTGNLSADDQKFITALRAAGGDSVEGLVALMSAGKVEAARRDELKAALVKQLNKDEKVAMGEALLKTMTLETLEGLDRSLNPLNYAGQGGPRIENSGGDDDNFAADAPGVVLLELSDDEKKQGGVA